MLRLRCAFGWFALSMIGALTACDGPNTDRGGSAPEPSGVIEGTVLYVGPRPSCEYLAGNAIAVRGNVILLLFRYDNPPPPQGQATSASNLLVVPGRELFALEDCLPEEPLPEQRAEVLTRSSEFVWPDVALANQPGVEGVDYQIRAFFDLDADFNPFFSVRRLATKGDIAGGAFVNTAANPPQFTRISFGSQANRPNGQVVSGVAVTLGAPVNTELPVSRLGDGTRGISSQATIPLIMDQAMREAALWELARMRLTLIQRNEANAEDPWVRTFTAAGMDVDESPSGYGWFIAPVDADRNGAQDPHPILGSAGIAWEHPIVILRRARNPVELAVGIPDAVLIASVRPSQTISKATFFPTIDIAVPPIVAVQTHPTDASCRVPYIAPGSTAETYERIPVDCQEIPTGNYDINVLTGTAGGRAFDYRAQLRAEMPGVGDAVLNAIVRPRTDTDWVIEGGQFSSQAWSIPNELGCPDPFYRPNARDAEGRPIAISQLDEDPQASCGGALDACDPNGTLMQCSQGPAGRFSVVDPEGGNAPDATDNSPGHGITGCQRTIRQSTMAVDTVTYMPVADACCEPIRHLCGLPLCELRDDAVLAAEGGVRAIRELRVPEVDYSVNADGTFTARCVPFLMPASCCD